MQIGVVTVKRTGQNAIEQTIPLNQQAKKQKQWCNRFFSQNPQIQSVVYSTQNNKTKVMSEISKVGADSRNLTARWFSARGEDSARLTLALLNKK